MSKRDKEIAVQCRLITGNIKGIYGDMLQEFAARGWVCKQPVDNKGLYGDMLQEFAALIRADEREACAKLCDKQAEGAYWEGADACAELIRAREIT